MIGVPRCPVWHCPHVTCSFSPYWDSSSPFVGPRSLCSGILSRNLYLSCQAWELGWYSVKRKKTWIKNFISINHYMWILENNKIDFEYCTMHLIHFFFQNILHFCIKCIFYISFPNILHAVHANIICEIHGKRMVPSFHVLIVIL